MPKILQSIPLLCAFTDIKRLCGRSYSDPVLSQELALISKVVCDDHDHPELVFNVNVEETCNCYPELLLAMLLDELKQRAENFLNNRRLVFIITVSPSFSSAQRAAILDAASVASLPVSRLLSDPLAAACAFRHHEMDGILKNRSEFTLLVVDVGACTTDASVVLLQDKQKVKLGSISLVSTRGSSALGGIDFDRSLCEVLLRQLRKSARAEVRADKAAMRRLMVTSEELKRTLSMVNQVRLFRLLSFEAISCNNNILFSLHFRPT